LTTKLAKLELELAFDWIDHLLRYANPAPDGYAFKPRRSVDAVLEDVTLVFDDVTDIDTHSEFNPMLQRCAGVSLDHCSLNFHGALRGVDSASELDRHPVASGLDDMPAMLLYLPTSSRRCAFNCASVPSSSALINRLYSRRHRLRGWPSGVDGPAFHQGLHPALADRQSRRLRSDLTSDER
jgi:hypothetical protein